MGPWAICGEALVHAEVQCRCVANDGEQRVEMSIRATIDTMSKEAMGLYKPNNILHTVAVVLVHCRASQCCVTCARCVVCARRRVHAAYDQPTGPGATLLHGRMAVGGPF